MAESPTRDHSSLNPSARLIVGIGASAGDLDAIQELLAGLEQHSETADGLAIVFLQHPHPASDSTLSELLSKFTSLAVVPVERSVKLTAKTVFVAPPRRLVEIRNGVLQVVPEEQKERSSFGIDHFFHSLAEDQGDRTVGIILSGAGSDGTLGLKAISDAGGMTFAQSPESAKYDSMPRNAATTGVADHVLNPAEIANELIQYVRHLGATSSETQVERMEKQVREAIPAIAERLMKETGHNFQHYKTSTLVRRISAQNARSQTFERRTLRVFAGRQC